MDFEWSFHLSCEHIAAGVLYCTHASDVHSDCHACSSSTRERIGARDSSDVDKGLATATSAPHSFVCLGASNEYTEQQKWSATQIVLTVDISVCEF